MSGIEQIVDAYENASNPGFDPDEKSALATMDRALEALNERTTNKGETK